MHSITSLVQQKKTSQTTQSAFDDRECEEQMPIEVVLQLHLNFSRDFPSHFFENAVCFSSIFN